jgi:hypothetical protein
MVVANQLFDALTAANIPREQAHAVVDALEHRMTSELATKADIAELRIATKADIAELRIATKADLAREVAGLKIEIANIHQQIADLDRRLTIRMGAMMIATAGTLFAALQVFGI